jgi:hypothetical protein
MARSRSPPPVLPSSPYKGLSGLLPLHHAHTHHRYANRKPPSCTHASQCAYALITRSEARPERMFVNQQAHTRTATPTSIQTDARIMHICRCTRTIRSPTPSISHTIQVTSHTPSRRPHEQPPSAPGSIQTYQQAAGGGQAHKQGHTRRLLVRTTPHTILQQRHKAIQRAESWGADRV